MGENVDNFLILGAVLVSFIIFVDFSTFVISVEFLVDIISVFGFSVGTTVESVIIRSSSVEPETKLQFPNKISRTTVDQTS